DERVRYIFKEAETIDPDEQIITFKHSSETVTYDYLVIGLGCEDNYHGVKGACDFADSVQSFSKARHAGMSVCNLKAYGKVTIVGAGLSGIEEIGRASCRERVEGAMGAEGGERKHGG